MQPIASRIRLVLGDLAALQDIDALVTAANTALCGGGGVDGAIHDAAGPDLVQASMALAPCSPGDARITPAFNLSARYVIHAVGPIFSNLEKDQVTLGKAYTSALSLAAERDISSIAFPCISTGAFGFPTDAACGIAINTVRTWLSTNESPRSVTFCCFKRDDHARYQARLSSLSDVGQ